MPRVSSTFLTRSGCGCCGRVSPRSPVLREAVPRRPPRITTLGSTGSTLGRLPPPGCRQPSRRQRAAPGARSWGTRASARRGDRRRARRPGAAGGRHAAAVARRPRGWRLAGEEPRVEADLDLGRGDQRENRTGAVESDNRMPASSSSSRMAAAAWSASASFSAPPGKDPGAAHEALLRVAPHQQDFGARVQSRAEGSATPPGAPRSPRRC